MVAQEVGSRDGGRDLEDGAWDEATGTGGYGGFEGRCHGCLLAS